MVRALPRHDVSPFLEYHRLLHRLMSFRLLAPDVTEWLRSVSRPIRWRGTGASHLIAKVEQGPASYRLRPLFQSARYRTVERTFLSADGRKRPVAGLFTAPTGLGAHPAVLHVHLPGVVLALLCAQTARFGTGLKCSPGHRWLEVRLPRDDPSC